MSLGRLCWYQSDPPENQTWHADEGGASLACYQSTLFSGRSFFSQWYFPSSERSTNEILWDILQALFSSAPRSRVLARLASLAQIGELARRLAVKLLKCQWDGIFLTFLARLFRAALIPYASVSNLECKKRVGRQHTTFTSCQNTVCSNEYFLFRVDYALEGSTFWLSNLCCRLFHAERSRHAYWFSAVVSTRLGMIDDFPSDARAFSLTSFETESSSSLWLNKGFRLF